MVLGAPDVGALMRGIHSGDSIATSSPTPSGVNRRTAVLFSNKTRKTPPIKTSGAEPPVAVEPPGVVAKEPERKVHRRPGRPPKNALLSQIVKAAVIDISNDDSVIVDKTPTKESAVETPVKDHIGRSAHKRRRTVDLDATVESVRSPKSNFSGVHSTATSSGDTSVSGRQSSSHHRLSAADPSQKKESFMQYRIMNHCSSDAEDDDKNSVASDSSSSSSSGSQSDCETTSSRSSSSNESLTASPGTSRYSTRGRLIGQTTMSYCL